MEKLILLSDKTQMIRQSVAQTPYNRCLSHIFCLTSPPQSKREGRGGAPEASASMISHSFSGLLKRL